MSVHHVWRHARPLILLAVLAMVTAVALPAVALPRVRSGERYIVVFDDSVADASAAAAVQASEFGGQVSFVYEHALKGYTGAFSAKAAKRLARDPRVRLVERDRPVSIAIVPNSQTGAPWGLDRIDQRALPLNGTFTYSNTGAGVTAYVIDTGIRYTHGDFGGRASLGTDAVTAGGSGSDCNGHGTHVAGTIGGTTYGAAKQVTLRSVRVLGCDGSGTTSGVIKGVDWVTGDHQAGAPAVANMSLGGGASAALDAAVRRSIADGVSYAIAAGNGVWFGAEKACRTSPARVSEAMTIGASDTSDRKASFSNYGDCVDWFAPGVGVLSDSNTSDTATATLSGTSMAAPHTAAVAALYLQSNPSASPSTVRTALFELTTKGIVVRAKTITNHLLFTNL